MRASHTSSMQIPRAHGAALALKAPTLYLFIFLWTHSRNTFTNLNPTHSSNLIFVKQQKILGVVLLKKKNSSEIRLRLSLYIQQRPDDGQILEALLGCFVFTCKSLNPPTSPPMHFPTYIFIFVTTDTLHDLKKKQWPQNQVSRSQHFTLCKAIKDLRGFAHPPDRQNFFQSSTFSLSKWREKLPIAEGQRSLHNYRNCCSVKAYYAMDGFNYYHW